MISLLSTQYASKLILKISSSTKEGVFEGNFISVLKSNLDNRSTKKARKYGFLLITWEKINQLIEGYKKIKNYLTNYGCYINNLAKLILKGNEKKIDDYIKVIKDNLDSETILVKVDDIVSFDEMIYYLELEADCLKALNLTNPEVLRIISPLVEKIISYKNLEIRSLLVSLIESLFSESLKNFLMNLLVISGGNEELIIPSVILSNLNINIVSQNNLHEILRNLDVGVFEPFIYLVKKLKEFKETIDDEKIIIIIRSLFETRISAGAGSISSYIPNSDIIPKISLVISILNINPKFILEIKSFSFNYLLNFIINKLFEFRFITDRYQSKLEFIDILKGSPFINNFILHVNELVNRPLVTEEVLCEITSDSKLKDVFKEDLVKFIEDSLNDPNILSYNFHLFTYYDHPYLQFIYNQKKLLGRDFKLEKLAEKLLDLPLDLRKCRKLNDSLFHNTTKPINSILCENDFKIFINLSSKIYPYIVKLYFKNNSPFDKFLCSISISIVRNLLTFNGLTLTDFSENIIIEKLLGSKKFTLHGNAIGVSYTEIARAICQTRLLSDSYKTELSEALINAIDTEKINHKTVEKIKNGELVFLNSGYITENEDRHLSCVCFYKDEFIVFNKGSRINYIEPIVSRFRYDKSKINLDILKYLVVVSFIIIEPSKRLAIINHYLKLKKVLPKILDAKIINEKKDSLIFFKDQKSNNCTKASVLTAIKFLVYLKSIEEGKSYEDARTYSKKVGNEISIRLRKKSIERAEILFENSYLDDSLKEDLNSYIKIAKLKLLNKKNLKLFHKAFSNQLISNLF